MSNIIANGARHQVGPNNHIPYPDPKNISSGKKEEREKVAISSKPPK